MNAECEFIIAVVKRVHEAAGNRLGKDLLEGVLSIFHIAAPHSHIQFIYFITMIKL